MLTFILLGGIALITGALLIIGCIFWDWDIDFNGSCVLSVAFFSISVALLIIFGCTLIGIKNDVELFKYRYENTKQLIETYQGNDYGNTGSIVKEVIEINQEIAKNKAYHSDPWVGPWYFEEIGNLEPLTFKKSENDVAGISD